MGAATLGSVFERYKLNATCHDCGQSKELDVGQLKDKYGVDFEIPRLNEMIKCTKCSFTKRVRCTTRQPQNCEDGLVQ